MHLFCLVLIIAGISSTALGFNPEENPNLFEGDMIISPKQLQELRTGGLNPNIPLAATSVAKWPRIIPYEISRDLTKEPKAYKAIMAAIADYHRLTCLRFVKRTNQKGYMSFFKGNGCYTYVGYHKGKNIISLGQGCWSKGIAIHEMAHSLGFYHEQSRPDRNSYVTINYHNMDSDGVSQFKIRPKSSIDSQGSPYDYDSVMHYGAYYFSKNGQRTIDTKNPKDAHRIGQRKGFSPEDVKQMNSLYQCRGEYEGVKRGSYYTRVRPVVTLAPVTKRPTYSKRNEACEGSQISMYCPGRKIKITYSVFGYAMRNSDLKIRKSCNRYTYSQQAYCVSSIASTNIKKVCEGRNYCSVRISKHDLGTPKRWSGNCKGLKYYAVVYHACV